MTSLSSNYLSCSEKDRFWREGYLAVDSAVSAALLYALKKLLTNGSKKVEARLRLMDVQLTTFRVLTSRHRIAQLNLLYDALIPRLKFLRYSLRQWRPARSLTVYQIY